MKRANIVKVTNTTSYNIVLWPKRRTYRDKVAVFIGSNSYKILDLVPMGAEMDLDTYYFQFQDDKKKIKIDECANYGIGLEYQLI